MADSHRAVESLSRAVDNQARQREAARATRTPAPTTEQGVERPDEGEKQP